MPKPAERKNIYGFTLLELLVVIAIIGVLVTIGAFGARGALQRARDSERKSDLSQYRNALEVFANNNDGTFPTVTVPASTGLCPLLTLIGCPEDPRAPTTVYNYIGSADGTEYGLTASLESGEFMFWAVCSDGRAGGYDTASGAACPLPML